MLQVECCLCYFTAACSALMFKKNWLCFAGSSYQTASACTRSTETEAGLLFSARLEGT